MSCTVSLTYAAPVFVFAGINIAQGFWPFPLESGKTKTKIHESKLYFMAHLPKKSSCFRLLIYFTGNHCLHLCEQFLAPELHSICCEIQIFRILISSRTEATIPTSLLIQYNVFSIIRLLSQLAKKANKRGKGFVFSCCWPDPTQASCRFLSSLSHIISLWALVDLSD